MTLPSPHGSSGAISTAQVNPWDDPEGARAGNSAAPAAAATQPQEPLTTGATGSRSYDELEQISEPTRRYVKHEIHGDNAWLVCKLCDKKLDAQSMEGSHVISNQHAKALKWLAVDPTYYRDKEVSSEEQWHAALEIDRSLNFPPPREYPPFLHLSSLTPAGCVVGGR